MSYPSSYPLIGYYGLFRPPYENGDYYRSTIYCMTNSWNDTLIMIPLVPNFFNDGYNIAKKMSYKKVYIVPPAIDVIYISDIYNLWYELKHHLKKECYILTNNKVGIGTSDEFLSDVIESQSHTISLFGDKNVNREVYTITFDTREMPISRRGSDILVSTWSNTIGRIYFANYMTPRKAKRLMDEKTLYHNFDYIHMPYRVNTYGGSTYWEIVKEVPQIISCLRAHSFTTYEELKHCEEMSPIIIPEGRRFNV